MVKVFRFLKELCITIILNKSFVCLSSFDISVFFSFLEPRFKPYFVTPVESTTTSPVNLRCNITSHFKPNNSDIYLLKNGFKKVYLSENQTSISIVPLGNNLSLIQPYNSILQYQMHGNYSAQGYYQCAVFTSTFMTKEARSKKLPLQFQGNVFSLNRIS